MLGNVFAKWLYDQIFGPKPPIKNDGQGGGILQAPGDVPKDGGGTMQSGDGATGGTMQSADKQTGCRPPFMKGVPPTPNPDWFVFTGVELALIVLMIVGILAVLFGNPETDISIAEVAAA